MIEFSDSSPSQKSSGEPNGTNLVPSSTKHNAIKETVRHLRLVVSNALPLSSEELDSSETENMTPFKVDIQHHTAGQYIMKAHDASNSIDCEIILKVKEAKEESESSTVICHFPKLNFQGLSNFCDEDETLFGILAVRFQMKVLEQLMLFCAEKLADTLVLIMDYDQAEVLEIYGHCKMVQKKISTPQGKKIQMIIDTRIDQYDAWVELMEETKLKFSQNLWSEQRSSPVIKNYLKTYDLARI